MSTVQFGKYQIKRELGRGAMGVVYEAEDADLGLEVALKVLALTPSATADAKRRRVERFYREAKALAGLRHPNVVRLFDQGEIGGRPYFSMELVQGTTLRDRIQMQGPLSVPDLVRLAGELCGALEHVHSRWVVHRDVKPENVMLLPDGTAKLMDFGIALTLSGDGIPPAGGMEGSPAYMSPEQVTGRPVDGRSDIYSLGITLYEAATGRRAVEGDSIPSIIHKVVHEYPAPPAGLPPFFQAVLLRCMAKDPAHRYRRAGEIAEDLRAGRHIAPLSAATLPPRMGDSVLGSPTRPLTPPRVLAGPPAASSERGCRLHPAAPAVAYCASCGFPMCFGCLVEIPGRGSVCRSCAFRR